MRLLFDERPLVLQPRLAFLLGGSDEAIILQQVHYWTQKKLNIRDGYSWVYNSMKEWHKQFYWISESKVKRIFTKLEKTGVLITGNYNKAKFDKTKWYRIDYGALDEMDQRLGQIDLTSGSKRPNGKGQIDPTYTIDYTETTTENNNNRSSDKSSDRVSEKQLDEDFNKLWKLYPKKSGKPRAFSAYKRAIKKGVTNKEIQTGIVKYLTQIKVQGTTKEYIKNGSTWFNQECWNDEYNLGQEKSSVNQKQSAAYAATDERKDRAEGFMRNLRDHPDWFTQDDVKAFLKDFPEMKEEVLKIERTRRKSNSDTAQ